jgi:hypothetical protein
MNTPFVSLPDWFVDRLQVPILRLKEPVAHNYNHWSISPLAAKNEPLLLMFSSVVAAFLYFAIGYHT